MYPSSSSSSSCDGHGLAGANGGLVRYDSAPGSLVTLSTCNPNNTSGSADFPHNLNNTPPPHPPSLVRHSSSPADFLNRMATVTAADNGFSVARGMGSYNSKGGSDSIHRISRLNSQLSFTKDSLSQITEESENVVDGNCADGYRKSAQSYATASYGMGSWDDTNSIMFSAPPSKRTKSSGSDIVNGLNSIDSQLQFGFSQTDLEMATMEKLIEIPQDSVPCKIRAKRGCATHPRSIAERERRTRISGKLKKLQDLVPNMDKQTSYSDMLDFAVQHIKGLQTQVQKLNGELENCTCGCKQNT